VYVWFPFFLPPPHVYKAFGREKVKPQFVKFERRVFRPHTTAVPNRGLIDVLSFSF